MPHDLPERAVEIDRHLRREIRPIGARERAAGLEIVGHVQRAPRLPPGVGSDRVPADRFDHLTPRLAVVREPVGRRRPVQQPDGQRAVPRPRAELGLARVAHRIVPQAGVAPGPARLVR